MEIPFAHKSSRTCRTRRRPRARFLASLFCSRVRSRRTFEPLTFLRQRSVGFVFVHQHLDLLRLQGGVEYLVETGVSLFVVDELRHLLHAEERTGLGPPGDSGEDTVNKKESEERVQLKGDDDRRRGGGRGRGGGEEL